EPASMPGRVVVQWDKEDCADMGIVKVDLLGLGMMAALKDSVELIRDHYREEVDLAHLPQDDPAVYSVLQQADTVGLFQVESRAQMSCLPRLRPKRFYDIVVQVAIIRPGPIVGQMVNPFLLRRQGREDVTYPPPSLQPVALYGFPESHAPSFALIAYASAYLKCRSLAAFTAALLNNQPMGFYSPATITKDAQRHGLKMLPADVMRSEWMCTLEAVGSGHWPVASTPVTSTEYRVPSKTFV